MMQVDNTFIKGMNLDLHPSVIPNDTLITCLNGTIKTNNGNEGILQNDMGNVKLTYAHLPDGYIPLGMKEYGGIVYVVSKNPFTNKCQIGSFPSPQQNQDSNDIFDVVNITAEDIIKDFLYEKEQEQKKEYLVKHTRITKRLCERITEGTAFNIGKYMDAKDTTPTSFMSFPSYVHYDKTNKIASINADADGALVTLNLGIKNDQGSIQKIDSVSGGDTNITSFNYLRTSGELYLIEELRLPPNEDFYILDVKKTNAGVELQFDYQGDLSFLTFSPKITSDGIKPKDNEHDYYRVTFSDTNGTSIELIRVFIEPSIQYNGNEYKIPQLKQEINIDVDDFSSQFLDDKSLTYQSQYTAFDNNLKISWGLVKAGNVEKVLFNFYQFDKKNKKFNTGNDTLEITGKRTFNGYFINQTDKLYPNSLYLVEIKCDYKDKSTSQVYYKWAWTSEIVKIKTDGFDLPLYVELNCDVVEKSQDENPIINDETTNGQLDYTITYKKNITFSCGNCTTVYADDDKLPVTPEEAQLNSVNSVSLDITYNELKSDLSYTGNYNLNDVPEATCAEIDSGIQLTTTYKAKSGSKEVKEMYIGKQLKPYLENDFDYDTIFGGKQNTIPKYGIAIGAGTIYKGSKNHCYCFVDFNSWLSNGSVDTVIDKFVEQDNIKYNNTKGSDRKWGDVIEPNLQKIYNKQLGYYPPISFIIAPSSTDSRYNGEGRTSELCRMTDHDGSTVSTDNKHEYSLILWKDTNESYKILRSVHTKEGGYSDLINLFKNLYILGDTVETCVVDTQNVVDTNNYAYTSSNTIDIKVDVSVKNLEVSNKKKIVDSIKDDIKAALKTLNETLSYKIAPENDSDSVCGNMVNLINITVISNNISSTFSKEYSLENYNILPYIKDYLKESHEDNNINYYVINGNKVNVVKKDVDNSNFKEGVIYYKTFDGEFATLNNATSKFNDKYQVCTNLDGYNLTAMKNNFTINEINKKQCIVLKSGLGLSSSPNTVWKDAHAAPFIGRYMSGNPHNETNASGTSGTYPFPLGASNYENYKYLCDFTLKNDNNKLW